MNKKTLFSLLCGLLLVAACSNEEVISLPSASPPIETADIVFNVSKPIENFDSFISDLRSAETIKLVTPDFTRIVKNNGVDRDFQIENGEYLQLSNDSISMILTDNYITLTSNLVTEQNYKNPATQYYLVHESKEYIAEYSKILTDGVNQLVKTRGTNEDSPQVAIHSENAISINQAQLSPETVLEQPQIKSTLSVSESKTLPETRNARIGNRPKNVLRIWLIRHRGYSGFQHEITWQQNDVRNMIKDLNPNVKIEFYTRYSDFTASSDAYETSNNFQEWVRKGKTKGYDWSSGVDKDIFIVVSFGGYNGGIVGLGFLNTYKLNRTFNPSAFGVSAISPIVAPTTLAHEIGHILGANHTDYTWWEGWWIFQFPQFDVMSYKPFRRSLIRDPKNVRIVRDNLRIQY